MGIHGTRNPNFVYLTNFINIALWRTINIACILFFLTQGIAQYVVDDFSSTMGWESSTMGWDSLVSKVFIVRCEEMLRTETFLFLAAYVESVRSA